MLETLKFESLLNDPSVISAREGTFDEWKARYVQAYRKSHRSYYEVIAELAAKLETFRPKVQALVRMNSIVELGPPLAATRGVEAELKALDNALWVCPDSTEADVAGKDSLCPKCQWRSSQKPSADALSRLTTVVSQGLADRFQRFKDASIAAILKKATTEGKGSGLPELLDIIQLADADRLAGVLNDDLIVFLRKVLYDETLVDEQIFLGPILQQVGPIEETRVDEAVSTLTRLLTRAVKDAKAKHGASKRVRVIPNARFPTRWLLRSRHRAPKGRLIMNATEESLDKRTLLARIKTRLQDVYERPSLWGRALWVRSSRGSDPRQRHRHLGSPQRPGGARTRATNDYSCALPLATGNGPHP